MGFFTVFKLSTAIAPGGFVNPLPVIVVVPVGFVFLIRLSAVIFWFLFLSFVVPSSSLWFVDGEEEKLEKNFRRCRS